MLIKLKPDQVVMIRRVEGFIRERVTLGQKANGRTSQRLAFHRKLAKVLNAIVDYAALLAKKAPRGGVATVFLVAPGQTKYTALIKERITRESIVVNYHTTKTMSRLNDVRVYNVGILVGSLNRLFNRNNDVLRTIQLWDLVFLPLYPKLRRAAVFIPCYYDHSSYALLFGRFRESYEVTEVQHGGIRNYFPYEQVTSVRLADNMIVWNAATARYLKEHLFKDVDAHIEVLPHKVFARLPSQDGKWIILYCSSIEIGGLHPAVLKFLTAQKKAEAFRLVIRLHPRERDRQRLFEDQVNATGWRATFDDSPNWIEGNPFEKLVVVSPWSSIIEEAFDNQIPSVVVDSYGRERFKDIIDESLCFTSLETCFEVLSRASNSAPRG